MIRVVLVDDHRLFVDGVCSILRAEIGIEVLEVLTQGVELLRNMESLRPDVVLTDIRMPGMDGVTLTRELLKTHPRTRVLGLSMLSHETDVMDMLEAGALGYLVKNVEREELVQAIHQVAKGKHYVSSAFQEVFRKWQAREPAPKDIRLTRRERQILELIARGLTSRQIADKLHLSRLTIDTHRKNIHKKLGVRSNVALVKKAQRYLD